MLSHVAIKLKISSHFSGQVQNLTKSQDMSAKDYAVQQAKFKLTSATEHLEVCLRTFTVITRTFRPRHKGRETPRNRLMQIMEHTVFNGSVHKACTQHKRNCIQIWAQMCFRFLCELGLCAKKYPKKLGFVLYGVTFQLMCGCILCAGIYGSRHTE